VLLLQLVVLLYYEVLQQLLQKLLRLVRRVSSSHATAVALATRCIIVMVSRIVKQLMCASYCLYQTNSMHVPTYQ
jgi:hypothetical protein